MEIRLSVCKDDGPVKSIKMHCNPFLIGRNDDCDLQLNSRSVSRSHCELKLKRTGLTIKDLGSRNGTIVNGAMVGAGVRMNLQVNDQVKIGKYRLSVLAIEGIGGESVEESNGETPSPRKASPEGSSDAGSDLLELLEQFITDHRDRLPTATEMTPNPIVPVPDKSDEHWTQLRQSAVEAVDDVALKPDMANEDPAAETTLLVDTVNELPLEDTQVEEAEARRLELRSRLEGLKAKDSREAADRALKNLFRR
jgi:pSer/pThr/pTyr-binding forkhead associated (FHA) protein